MRSPRRAAAVLVGCSVSGVVLLTGCSDYQDGSRPAQVAAPSQARCASTAGQLPRFEDGGQLVGAGRVPDGFQPVGVVHCLWDERYLDDGATRSEVTVQEFRSPTVPAALLESLALPDQEFTRFSHGACPAIGTTPQYLILVDASRAAVMPWLPETPCSEPRVEVVRAINDLSWTDHQTYRFRMTNTR